MSGGLLSPFCRRKIIPHYFQVDFPKNRGCRRKGVCPTMLFQVVCPDTSRRGNKGLDPSRDSSGKGGEEPAVVTPNLSYEY